MAIPRYIDRTLFATLSPFERVQAYLAFARRPTTAAVLRGISEANDIAGILRGLVKRGMVHHHGNDGWSLNPRYLKSLTYRFRSIVKSVPERGLASSGKSEIA